METTPASVPAPQEPDTAPKAHIFSGQVTIVRVTPPDYATLLPGADRSGLKATVTCRSDVFAGDWNFTIDRSRIADFEEMAFNGTTIPITVG
jgi:hypothetical protein